MDSKVKESMFGIVAIHKNIYADREFAFDEPYITENGYTAILSDGSSRDISRVEFDTYRKAGVEFNVFCTETCEGEEWTSGIELTAFHAKFRPCTCGSGEPWASCGANSQHCG